MKKKLVLLLAIISTTSASAFAFEDIATIKKVEPQYTSVNQPREVCREEIIQETVAPTYPQYQQPQGPNYGGTILGGLAGGIIGNQVGGGTGKTIATAAGAVVGALVGDNLANRNNQPQPQYQNPPQVVSRPVHMCRMEDNIVQIISGYNVEYSYNGRILTTILHEKPIGNKIKVEVQIQPVVY